VKESRGIKLLMFLPLTVLLIVSSIQTVAQDQNRRSTLAEIEEKAWRTGSVGIIVRLDVPGLRELTAASASFRGKDASPAVTKDRSLADYALKDAIEYASWKMVTELEGTRFSVNAVYGHLPFIALRADPNALSVLKTSPTVLGLDEDVPHKLIHPVEDGS